MLSRDAFYALRYTAAGANTGVGGAQAQAHERSSSRAATKTILYAAEAWVSRHDSFARWTPCDGAGVPAAGSPPRRHGHMQSSQDY